MNGIDTKARVVLPLIGLEPDNLLAFLALLGLLRAIEESRPHWRPRFCWAGIPLRGEVHIDSPAAKEEFVTAADEGIRRLAQAYEFDRSDITYTPSEYRALSKRMREDRWHANVAAALASDGALRRDGESVEPTPLCAMFGQGHQHFLARLVASAKREDAANIADLSRALFEPWRYEDDTDGFRWDPVEDRRYALQFGDPSEGRNKIGTVTGANRLASIGFALFASVPANSGLATIGVAGRRRERDVCWPLASVPAGLDAHLSLLAHPNLSSEEEGTSLKPYGVAAIARARRYQVGKFFNFERARVQRL